jgi:hypothetical protein
MIYTTLDKSVMMTSLEEINETVRGYDMRTEVFISVAKQDLVPESVSTVFKYVNGSDTKLIGRIAAKLNADGILMEEIAMYANLSIRTLHRYMQL